MLKNAVTARWLLSTLSLAVSNVSFKHNDNPNALKQSSDDNMTARGTTAHDESWWRSAIRKLMPWRRKTTAYMAQYQRLRGE